MKKVKDTEYVFITPFVRAREAKLLSREQQERMLEAQSVQEAAAVAAECGYEGLEPISSESLEKSLGARRAELFAELRSLAPETAVVDALSLKYDYHNAKVVIKAAAMKQDGERLMSAAGRVPPKEFLERYGRRELGSLPAALGKAVAEADEVLSRTGDPQLSDFVLDKAYLAEMLELAEKAGSSFLEGYAKRLIDSANLRAAVRAMRMGKTFEFIARVLVDGGDVGASYIVTAVRTEKGMASVFTGALAPAAEYGDTLLSEGGSLTGFERLCDRAVSEYLDGAKLIAFGEQPLIGYICAVENEIKTIRTILAGRLSGLPAENIRERLREKDG